MSLNKYIVVVVVVAAVVAMLGVIFGFQNFKLKS